MKTPRAKKPTKQEKIDHLTNLLNLRCSELEEVIGREKEIYRTLGGTPGEHPLERAKRVVAERSGLADKVLGKSSEVTRLTDAASYSKQQRDLIIGKMEAIRAITES